MKRILKTILLLAVIMIPISFIYKIAIYDKMLKIEVQKLESNENVYEEFNEISNQKDVKKIRRIIDDIVWETVVVKMNRPADYVFYFQYMNPNIQAKVISYEIWINSESNLMKICRNSNNYSLLTEEDTLSFINILLR